MNRFILELTEENEAELIDTDSDESVWSSYDDDDYDGDPGDEEAVTSYLERKGIIESRDDIIEVVDETGEFESIDDDDYGDDDSEESDDDDD